MARKNDQAAIHSSLALLQERFNQLQKTREMRQERELMRLISGARERHAAASSSSSYNNNSAAMHYHHHHHQPSMFYDSELTFQYQNRALSFFPDSRMKRPGFGEIEGASQETESWVFGTSLGQHSSTTVKFDHDSKTTSDVDTSLRL